MVTRREGVSGEGEMGKRVNCVVTDRSWTSSGAYGRVYTEAVVYTEIKIQACVPEAHNVVNQGYLLQSQVFLGLLYNF